jgi:DNA-binding NarL/FixJ family response regulator
VPGSQTPPPQVAGQRVEAKLALAPRVLIVDDQPSIRTAVGILLDSNCFQVCGEAADGSEAIEKVLALKPDIVILDIKMPQMNGIDAAHEIRRISPNTKIIFLTLHDTAIYEKRTRAFGRLIPKSEAATELIPVLRGLAATDSQA